jgi:hypothetical protein
MAGTIRKRTEKKDYAQRRLANPPKSEDKRMDVLSLAESWGSTRIVHRMAVDHFCNYIRSTALDAHRVISLLRVKQVSVIGHQYILLRVCRDRDRLDTWVRLERGGILGWGWVSFLSGQSAAFDSVSGRIKKAEMVFYSYDYAGKNIYKRNIASWSYCLETIGADLV